MSVDHTSTIDANKTDLLEVLRVSELLLTELCGEDVLDQRTKQEILAGGIQYEINGRFLDWLQQSQHSTFTVCLEKLRGDQQNHIANLLDGTPGERPLTREKRQQIQKNIRNLSEVIDVDSGLLVLLCSKRALSRREHQEINSEKVTEDKAMKLLQIILQKSDRTLNCFVDALRETNQGHVISTLEKGNIIALHAQFRSASDLLDQFEDDLINILEPLAQQVSYLDNEEDQAEEVQPIIHELQEICQKRIKILSLKKGKSITIYLWCDGVEAMAELFLMFETRHLEHILQKIFNLVKTSVKVSNTMIRVTLTANDLQILKEAVKLNELVKKKTGLAESDSLSESRGTVEKLSTKTQQAESTTLYLRCKRRLWEFLKRRGGHNVQGENQPLIPRRRKSSESIELIIVRGIAALKNKIYIIFQDRSFIRVIGNTEEFVKEDDIQILGIKEPWSLEAYKDDNHLYISDRKHKCIWRVTVTSGEKGLTKRICELHNPYKFSVASGGRLVVPIWPNSLQIRKSDGSIEKTIALHKDMQEPYYALETSKETFIVAHGHEQSQLQGVCEVRPTEQGQCLVEWSFPEGDSDKIWNIDQLAMDEDGRIYVTDQNKGRILVLDKDGKKICESNTEKLPYRLCYAAEKKQLLVGHYGAVSVYTLESEEGQGTHKDDRMLQLQQMFECDKLSRNEKVVRSSGPAILGSNQCLAEYKTNMDIGDFLVTGIAELDGRLNVIFQEKNFIRIFKAIAPFEKEAEKMQRN